MELKEMTMGSEINPNSEEKIYGFCGGCRSNCSLSSPNCPTGMERAGWSSEEIEKAMAERAVPIKHNVLS